MSSQTESSTLPRREQDGDIVVDAIVEVTAFQEYLEILRSVADEARIHFNDTGVRSSVVDPANVAMQKVGLGLDAFENYDAGAVTIGVNLERVSDELDLATAGDLVRVRVDMETRKLRLSIGDHIHPNIALIDPDAMRAEPDIPDLDLPNTATVSPDKLDTAITAVDNVTDHIKLGFDGETEELVFYGEGDVDDTRIAYELEDLDGESHIGEPVASLYSLDFWENVVGAFPSGVSPVTMHFGADFPTKWQYDAHDGALDVTTLIAPRIDSS